MNKFFSYFGLASSIIASVSALQAVVHMPVITGAAIENAIYPVISSLPVVLPHINIPKDLVTELAAASAVIINDYFKKHIVTPKV